MKIFTYYQPIGGFDVHNEESLIALWKTSWSQHGYEPIVLGLDDAKKHPMFDDFNARMEKLPTVNGYSYEGACYHRWLAVQHYLKEHNEAGMMADYDVMCYSKIEIPKSELTIFSLVGQPYNDYEGEERLTQTPNAPKDAIFAWVVPCLVFGSSDGFQGAIEAFMSHQPSSFDWIWAKKLHTSDQFILTQLRYSGLFETSHQCSEAFRDEWHTAAVHYPNGVMTPRNLRPRYSNIIPLRKFFVEPNRLDIPRMSKQDETIIEVGVAGGNFTAYLGDHYKGKVIGIDPYRLFPSDEWKDCINSSKESLDAMYKSAVKALAGKRNVTLLRKDSTVAATGFKDNSIASVFIDGNHMYEACKADIKAWWPKVMKGGFLCGHDYTSEDEVVTPHVTLGVGKAVREFCKDNNLEHAFGFGPDGMWVIQK